VARRTRHTGGVRSRWLATSAIVVSAVLAALVWYRAGGDRARLETGPAGYVDFATEPAGAEVQLDGRSLGVTPATFALPSGVHEFEVRKPGYLSSQITVRVPQEAHVPVDLPLIPITAGQ
jgi:hypothetical protein